MPGAGAEQFAELFHETYERLAPEFGYTTRTDTRRFDRGSHNGKLMIAVCDYLLTWLDEDAPAELKRLRAVAEERDELVLEVARLQHALAFWLPQVPAADNAAAIRCGNDAMLLAGCECPLEPCAEELGWITMHTPETESAK